jgi:hypothetical protein
MRTKRVLLFFAVQLLIVGNVSRASADIIELDFLFMRHPMLGELECILAKLWAFVRLCGQSTNQNRRHNLTLYLSTPAAG